LTARAPIVLAFAALSCAASPPVARPAPEPPGARWQYEVDVSARELTVRAAFRGSIAGSLVVADGADPFVRDLEIDSGAGWAPARRAGTGWSGEACRTSCRLRYRFALREAADKLADVERAIAYGSAIQAPPSTWLLRPELAQTGDRYRLQVRAPEDVPFVTGLYPSSDGAYETNAAYLASAPYTSFGAPASATSLAEGVTLITARAPGELAVTSDDLALWARAAASSVSTFFGCFPVPRLVLLVVPVPGSGVRRGHALGDGGAAIVVEVGQSADARALAEDWVLVHEMLHLGVPSVPRRSHWLEEGVAVYMQPIVRARGGAITAEAAWRELAQGMHKGLPGPNDTGLDGAAAWTRTYWGGALFVMLADLQIRERTEGRRSIDDALRALVRSGGSIADEWTIERVLDTGDRATGVPVLRDLYSRMGVRSGGADLPALWRSLGVGEDGALHDDAPLAAVRRAITERRPIANVAACSKMPAP
jgi:hypothetical protein